MPSRSAHDARSSVLGLLVCTASSKLHALRMHSWPPRAVTWARGTQVYANVEYTATAFRRREAVCAVYLQYWDVGLVNVHCFQGPPGAHAGSVHSMLPGRRGMLHLAAVAGAACEGLHRVHTRH